MLNKITKAIQKRIKPEQLKVLINIGWLLSERVFRMIMGFFLLAWTARYLGANQFGELNYAIAFGAIFLPLFQLASDQIIFRDLVRTPNLKENILGTGFLLKLVLGIIVFILASVSIIFLQPNEPLTINLVIIISIPSLFGGISIIEAWFQSQVELKYTIWSRNIVFALVTLIRIFLLQNQASLMAFAWLVVIENAANAIGFIVIYRLTGKNILAWRGNWKRAKKLMKVSWPLILSSLAITIYLRIDQVMLGQLADAEQVGLYSAAVRLSEVWPFASTAIIKSIAPSIIAAKNESEELYYKKLQRLATSQALLVYCIAIPMTFLSTPFVILVFGKEYAAAGGVLAIHIWSSMFLFLGYVKEIWITTEELTVFAFFFSVVGAVTNVILNFLLIPKYQAMGAAIATVVSYGCADYLACFFYKPARKFGWIMTQAMTLNLIKYRP
ncbi:flippase [Planktothrix paucivesiculata]|uniref:Polysaccharide biosynthesis protein n=1 Tax=Planktothrix paucivesiculata PCC 9631 TaxID=671071 RepID=A0A7Z9BWN7_9CYAN|nr:flippase [Planktothrix paucivesiculata]VXD24154.1 Polysaccharide biosynthesis protein [Planktothrix paucivesiculata PCC 9631]